MADEPVTEEEPTRELTLEEANKPIIDTMGQQATGVVDLGQGRLAPEQQAIQSQELLTPEATALDPAQREIAAT